ncbi:YHS domain-containing protein [Limnovirga soli]|jgi:YHS domain-containing protein|uniref:YHS domain-containing protein n=1 Tax=Limnovirga soli TaxID=2656915 RepID=A0A8J8FJS3_9BACT|nr:YHS domain-containing protein [Limnovirga soli]NNV56334.1 YHS domain-containing protein [Limnovirga soli]
MKKTVITLALCTIVLFACNQSADKTAATKDTTAMTTVDTTVSNNLSSLTLAADKDKVCGMPISAGLGDTSLYKGAIYGFCSKECKDEFLKNPDGYLAQK